MEAELAKFNAVQARLREVIREIVKRHAVSGKPLSWKLMFEIEEEALAVLCRQRDLDAGYVRLMSAPPASAPPPPRPPWSRRCERSAPGRWRWQRPTPTT